MLQLIVWMLCVYMILKAVELWLIAAATNNEHRRPSMVLAIIAGAAALLAAAFFFSVAEVQVQQTPEIPNFSNIPTYR